MLEKVLFARIVILAALQLFGLQARDLRHCRARYRYVLQSLSIDVILLTQLLSHSPNALLFPGEFRPKRLVFGTEISRFEERIVHPKTHDLVAARQRYRLAHRHKRTVDLLTRR